MYPLALWWFEMPGLRSGGWTNKEQATATAKYGGFLHCGGKRRRLRSGWRLFHCAQLLLVIGDFFCIELVGYFGWGGIRAGWAVECPDAVTDLLVGGGVALAGAEVVEPGFHDEGLVEVLGVVGFAVDAPAHSSVT